MPSKVLRCNQCEDVFNTVALNQNLLYRFKNTDIAMSRTVGFCRDCDSLVVMESFEDIDHQIEQIDLLSEQALEQARRVLSINVTPAMKDSSAYAVRGLVENAYFLAIALKRKGDERCLRCLSQNVVVFDGDMNLEYGREGVYAGAKGTGFHHPGCGGEYIVSGSEARFHLGRNPRHFPISDHWEIGACTNW
jgi:hypothetical protein